MAGHFFGNPRALAVGAQTDISTPNAFSGDHHVFAAEYDLPVPEYGQTDWKGGTRVPGTRTPPVPGRRSASFKVKFPVRAGKSNYVVADSPVSAGFCDPGMLLIGSALGSAGASGSAADWKAQTHLAQVIPVAAAVVAGGDANTVKLDGAAPTGVTTSTIAAGKFLACATDAADTVAQVGWAKTVINAEPGDSTVELYEAAANTADVGDRILGAVIAYLSNAQPNPVSFKGYSSVTNGDFLLTGCYAKGWTITIGGGDVWWVEIDYWCADYTVVSGASTLPASTGAWRMMRPATSAVGGRLTYGPSGTGSATNVPGFRNLKIAGTTAIDKIESLGGIQGLGTPALAPTAIKVTGELAWDSGDTVTDGEHELVTAWRDGTAFSLCATVCYLPGRIVSLFLPSLVHAKAPLPKASGEGGLVYYEIEAESGEYLGDATSAADVAPADSPFRIAIA